MVLADDLIDSEVPVLKQLIDVSREYKASVLGVQEVPRKDTKSYGIVSGQALSHQIARVTHIVEKPEPAEAPSTLAVVGRYILSPRIFHHLERIEAGRGGEIQLTDGISALMKEEAVMSCLYDGTRYDCGSKLGYLQATFALGRKHPEVGEQFSAWIRDNAF